jgi:hypothetical protein
MVGHGAAAKIVLNHSSALAGSMMRSLGILIVLASLIAPAVAGDDGKPQSDNRYSYDRVENGFVRLDMRTGQVSLCAHRSTGWSCQTMPDDRAAFENEIARLAGENAALKKELIDRGLLLPPVAKAEPPAAPDVEPKLGLPKQADVDRMVSCIERVWRRFMQIIVTMQQDWQKKT